MDVPHVVRSDILRLDSNHSVAVASFYPIAIGRILRVAQIHVFPVERHACLGGETLIIVCAEAHVVRHGSHTLRKLHCLIRVRHYGKLSHCRAFKESSTVDCGEQSLRVAEHLSLNALLAKHPVSVCEIHVTVYLAVLTLVQHPFHIAVLLFCDETHDVYCLSIILVIVDCLRRMRNVAAV